MVFIVYDLANDLRNRRRGVYVFMRDGSRIVQLRCFVRLIMLLEVG